MAETKLTWLKNDTIILFITGVKTSLSQAIKIYKIKE